MLDSILWVGRGRQDTAGTRPEIAGALCESRKKRSVGGGGEIRRSSINIMEICYNSARSLSVDYRRRHRFPQAETFCLHAETENLPAESHLLANRESRRVTKRESLLQ